jgi:hypothetical protein
VQDGDTVMVMDVDGNVAFVGLYRGWASDELMMLVEHDIPSDKAENPIRVMAHNVQPFNGSIIHVKPVADKIPEDW